MTAAPAVTTAIVSAMAPKLAACWRCCRTPTACDAAVQAARAALAAWVPMEVDGDSRPGTGRVGAEGPTVHRGMIVSGDSFISSGAACRALQADLPHALAVEMEGAALAQVCHDFGLPFAVVRTVSDRADDDAHLDFERVIEQRASRCSVAIARRWLAQLPRA